MSSTVAALVFPVSLLKAAESCSMSCLAMELDIPAFIGAVLVEVFSPCCRLSRSLVAFVVWRGFENSCDDPQSGSACGSDAFGTVDVLAVRMRFGRVGGRTGRSEGLGGSALVDEGVWIAFASDELEDDA